MLLDETKLKQNILLFSYNLHTPCEHAKGNYTVHWFENLICFNATATGDLIIYKH